jgi:WD40 repeat protein
MRGVAVIDWTRRTLVKEWQLANGPFVVMPMADNSGVFAIGIDHLIQRLQLDAEPIASIRIIEDGPSLIPAHSDYFLDEQVLAIHESSQVSIIALGDSHAKIDRIPVEASVTAIRFSADGKRLAIAIANRKIAIWDWRGKRRLMELSTRGTCSSMDFSRDGRWLVNTDYGPCLMIR